MPALLFCIFTLLFNIAATYNFYRKAVVKIGREVKADAMSALVIEIKLFIIRRLFEQGYITEQMHIRAKEIIVKQAA